MRLTEENIENVAREYLRNEGYKVYPKEARGVDIKAMHSLKRRYYFIEVKGEPSREYVKGKKKPEAIGAHLLVIGWIAGVLLVGA